MLPIFLKGSFKKGVKEIPGVSPFGRSVIRSHICVPGILLAVSHTPYYLLRFNTTRLYREKAFCTNDKA